MRIARAALLLAIAAIIVAGIRRAIASDATELAASVQDDSFYYLLPAFRAWQAGGVLTFDGEHAMFAVQPAFAALLTLLAGFCPDREMFLRAAVALVFVLYAAIAIGLAVLVERRFAGASPLGAARAHLAGSLAGIAWCLNLPVLYGFTTLKENVLYALLLLAAFALATGTDRDGRESRTRRQFGLGLVLGLGLATRLTPSSLLIAAVFAGCSIRLAIARRLAVVRVVAGLAVGLLPFVAYGLATVGRTLPTSGSVKMAALHAALADGSYWTALSTHLAEVPRYVWACIRYATGLPHDYFHVPQSPGPSHAAGPLLACLSIAGFVTLVAVRRTAPTRPALLALLLLAAIAGKATTPLLLGPGSQVSYFQWYVAALPVLAAVTAGGMALVVAPMLAAMVGAAAGIGATIQVLVHVQPAAFHADAGSWTRQMIVACQGMNDLLPPHARVAAANTGALGYFAREDLVVINIDGLANDDYFDSRQMGEPLRSYLDRKRIAYLCDVISSTGIAGNLFDGVTPLDVSPFHGPDYEGYFLLERRAGERFPDFWTPRGPRSPGPPSAVRCVPWCDGDPFPDSATSPAAVLPSGRRGIWRSLQIDPSANGDARPVFYPGGQFSQLHAHVAGRRGELVVRAEAGELLRVATADDRWLAIEVVTDNAARVELEFLPAGESSRPLWIAGIGWVPASSPSGIPAAASVQPFGHGCSRDDHPPPLLSAISEAKRGETLRLVVRGAAAGAGMLCISRRPTAVRFGSTLQRDPCHVWTSDDVLMVVPLAGRGDGETPVDVALPRDLPPGRYVVQALLGIDAARSGLSNGLLLFVPAE